MISSLLLKQCPPCLVCWIWMVLEMGGRWPYSCCFVGCCFQDLFITACSILVHLPSSFFSIYFVNIYVVHPYSSMNKTAKHVSLSLSFFVYIYIYIYITEMCVCVCVQIQRYIFLLFFEVSAGPFMSLFQYIIRERKNIFLLGKVQTIYLLFGLYILRKYSLNLLSMA